MQRKREMCNVYGLYVTALYNVEAQCHVVTCHVSPAPGHAMARCCHSMETEQPRYHGRTSHQPRASEVLLPECLTRICKNKVIWVQNKNMTIVFDFRFLEANICPVGGMVSHLLIIIRYCRIVTIHGDRAASLRARARRGLGPKPPGVSEARLIGWRHSEAISRSSDGNRRW